MEKPVQLKHKPKLKRSSSTDSSGRSCIVHYESTVGEQIGRLSKIGFAKIHEVAQKRLSCDCSKSRVEHICSNLPDTLDTEHHGTHRRCYQLFTNISRLTKRESITPDDVVPGPSTSKRRRSSTESSCSTVLFPANKCLFCDKEFVKVKGAKQSLTKCITKCAEDSIKNAATDKNDHELLCKIQNQDLVAREAYYHSACRKNYTRKDTRHVSHSNSDSTKSQKAHGDSFEYLCRYMEDHILEGQNVERLTMLKERYLTHLLEHHPSVYNENYKTYKLKDKLVKHFGDRIRFWQPASCNTTSELVYGANVEGNAIEKAFELAASDERRLAESAMLLRRYIFDARRQSCTMPWPPSSEWLLSDARKPPDMLINFIVHLISGKSDKYMNAKTKRCATSFSEDICYATTNGEWLMPKHILLPMTVRHLTGNAELITILNRYGHAQSYVRTMELETAMCNAVTASESVLPPNISTDNNDVLHLCWDNFDLNEETLSGSGTTHSTHGIIIQEVIDKSTVHVADSQPLPKTGERTIKPAPVEIRPCYAKAKVEPKMDITKSAPNYSFKASDMLLFIWLLCRDVGSSYEVQTVPSWSGWLSKTAGTKESDKSTVEYMAPINFSINESSTVQHILETSLAASHKVGQEYAIVTFDLAVAKKAYSLVWQYAERFSKVIVRMGVFHTICSIFSTVGKMMKGSGFSEIVIESGICASGSLEKVLSGKHYNRALRVHKLVTEGLERLLMKHFETEHSRTENVPDDLMTTIQELAKDPTESKLEEVLSSQKCNDYFEHYLEFKDSIRNCDSGKTAQFWLSYMDIIHLILTLIRATKANDLDLHIAALYRLCPMFFGYDHSNYARYVPVYLMTLLNLTSTHPGARELLERNGFSVSRSSVPNSRNPVDITIEQTINKHAKSQGGIIGFSRNYSAYYRWCTTRHCRAKYVEALLQVTDMTSEETSAHKELQPAQIQGCEADVNKVIEAICGFTNPFSTDNNPDELYCLSSGVPAKPDVAADLLKAYKIGQTAMEDFINSRLVNKTTDFHSPIKRNKLKTFATTEVTKTVRSTQNKITQIKAERNIFGQLVLLSVQHDIDLQLTLSYPLGPVPWSLATADGMPVKTDKSKLMHILESNIEPTTTHPRENVVHIFDGNATLQSLPLVPDTFEQLAETVFNMLPKQGRVDFVTDTYSPTSIKSFERRRRGSTPTLLLSGPKTKTPKDWKSFMANDENKSQLLHLLFNQWKTDKYAEKLRGRHIYYVLGERCYNLTSQDGISVEVFPEETLFSSQEEADTRIILHCIHIRDNEPESLTIIVRSPDTDVLVLLTKYTSDISRTILFDTGVGNKRRLLNVNEILADKGEDICSVLPAIHCFTGCDTTSAFVRKGKTVPFRLVQKNPEYISTLAKLGQDHECTEELLYDIEKFVCCIYGKPKYSEVNKLRFDTFCKKNQGHGNILDSYNSVDMSLLPPCRASLEMHVRRVNYQLYVWLHSHENYPQLPDLEKSGWKLGPVGIEYNWTSGNIVPQELVDILCCNETDSNNSSDSEEEDDVELENLIDIVFDDNDE